MHHKSSKSYSGDREQDSYLIRNVLHLSGIITLGNLKSNID